MKLARAASLLEGGEIRAAVGQRIERIPVGVEPGRWLREADATLQELLVGRSGCRAARRAEPAADEIDRGLRQWVRSGPGDGEGAAARMTTDDVARGVDE